MEQNIREIIHVTSGVEINKTDTITQMVWCYQTTLKMYKFRTTFMKNHKELKLKCGVKNPIRPSSTSATTNTQEVPRPKSVASDKNKPSLPAKYRHAHPSIKEIVLKVPNIRLPDEALILHDGPYITLLKDEVDDWFMEHNYTEKEIEKIKREAYELANESDEQKKRKMCQTDAERKTRTSTPERWKRRKMSVDLCSESTTNSEVNALFHHTDLSKKSVNTNKLPTNLKLDIKRDRLNDFVKSDNANKVVSQKFDKRDNDSGNQISEVQRGDIIEKSILNRLLTQQEFSAKKNENITLKSILDSNGISKNKPEYDEVIVIDPPSPPPKHHSKEETTTSTEGRAEPNVIKTATTSTNTEETLVFILSDSDDGGADTNNINEDTTDNDSIVFNIDTPSSSNSGTSKEKATDKTTFTEALQLAPKPSTASNMPDLSLVSLANRRPYPLYTCKVCDSQHGSLKDLKHHQRRTHTRCPFCTKRFHSLAHRDEHVKTNCLVSTSSVKHKKLRLQLVRVEELEEIRKKYPKAFENEDNASNISESNLDVEMTSETAAVRTEAIVVDIEKKHPEAFERKKKNDNKSKFSERKLNVKMTSEKSAVRTQAIEVDNSKKHPKASEKKQEKENNKKSNFSESNLNVGMSSEKPEVCAAAIVVDLRTEEAINELESFFNVTEVIPEDDPKVVTSKKMNNKKKKDVICISDEETDPEIQILSVQTVPQPKTTIQPKPQQRQTTPVQPITTLVPPPTTPVQPPITPEDGEVILIDPPLPPLKHHSKEKTKSTSTEDRAEPIVIKTKTTSINTEETLVFILSDSDDGGTDTNNINEDTTDTDSIAFNIDTPSSSNSGTSNEKDTDKTAFAEALQLVPKPSTSSNMPDLSLVSLANRTYLLYTCKVCDSQHVSLKKLKHHQRRTHTICSICTKKFRSLAHREEHFKTNCLVSTSSVKLKRLRLELVRVEENEEIMKRYPKAFEKENNTSNFFESNLDVEVTSEIPAVRTEATVVNIGKKYLRAFEKKKENDNKSYFSESNLNVEATTEKSAVRTQAIEVDNRKKHPKASKKKKGKENKKKSDFSESNLDIEVTSEQPKVCAEAIVVDPRTEEVIKELESFFNVTEVIPEDDPKVATSKKMNKKKKDVICISDEETETEIQILSVQSVPKPKTTRATSGNNAGSTTNNLGRTNTTTGNNSATRKYNTRNSIKSKECHSDKPLQQ